jgi:N-carbamoyl-L-amino-acid hydrolase
VRHPDDDVTAAVVADITRRATVAAAAEGCELQVVPESVSPTVSFHAGLTDRLVRSLPGAPRLGPDSLIWPRVGGSTWPHHRCRQVEA